MGFDFVEGCVVKRKTVAARLAGGGDLESAIAGKPDCYGFCVCTGFEVFGMCEVDHDIRVSLQINRVSSSLIRSLKPPRFSRAWVRSINFAWAAGGRSVMLRMPLLVST
jgi:hypothetical protein